jgi:hypothetical protein
VLPVSKREGEAAPEGEAGLEGDALEDALPGAPGVGDPTGESVDVMHELGVVD